MILNQLIVIFTFIVVFASASEKLIQAGGGVGDVSEELSALSASENDEFAAFSHLLNFIDIICQEALKREDKKAFIMPWMEGLQVVIQEIYKKNSYTEIRAEEDFDTETLTLENDFHFDEESLFEPKQLKNFLSTSQIILSDDSSVSRLPARESSGVVLSPTADAHSASAARRVPSIQV